MAVDMRQSSKRERKKEEESIIDMNQQVATNVKGLLIIICS